MSDKGLFHDLVSLAGRSFILEQCKYQQMYQQRLCFTTITSPLCLHQYFDDNLGNDVTEVSKLFSQQLPHEK